MPGFETLWSGLAGHPDGSAALAAPGRFKLQRIGLAAKLGLTA